MIDERIATRLNTKTRKMAEFLNDKSIISNFTNLDIKFEDEEKKFLKAEFDDGDVDIDDYQDLLENIVES